MLGILMDICNLLIGRESENFHADLKVFVRNWGKTKVPVPVAVEKFLEFLGTKTIRATTSRFVASQHFVVNTTKNAKPKISFIGEYFTKWFLGKDGITEEPKGQSKLCYHRLTKKSFNPSFITELGGEEKSNVALSKVDDLMSSQPNGEAGTLLTDSHTNFFYIYDKHGVLRVVDVSWKVDGWRVLAFRTSNSYLWFAGDRVFSRK